MSWIPGLSGDRRRPRREARPAIVEVLETRAVLATVTVDVINFAFDPTTVTIHVGDTVHWVWDADYHSTTSVAGSAEQWNSGVQNTGFTFDHTFTKIGTFVGYAALFREPGTDNQDFHAFINWGDGSRITPGHIHGRGNAQYAVLGSHRYVKPGEDRISVQIRDGIGRKIATDSLVRVITS